ncbi:hypothetical protein FOA52_002515 [Chlamydomonas sp. UWO 241]|nr:hypothetical protein FOA52_002515 [Chlamydomonas sp. UWO 241]
MSGGAGGAWGGTAAPAPHDDDDLDSPAERPQTTWNPPQQPNAPAPAGASTFLSTFQPSAYQASTSFQPAAYQAPVVAPGGGGEQSARLAALNKKEKELEVKELKLKKLEAELKDAGGVLVKKNWPICLPMLHHDIAGEIPDKSKRVVREFYLCWWALLFILWYQFFCASIVMGYKADKAVASWFLTLVFIICGVPISFLTWYRSMYKAAQNDSTASYIFFFIMFLVHCGFSIWSTVAFPVSSAKWSFCGWMTAIAAFDEGNFPGIIYIVGASMWTILSLYSLWCLKDSYFFFRGKGGVDEQKKAQEDVAISQFAAAQQGNGSQRV